jgi:serine/threonine protein kinase
MSEVNLVSYFKSNKLNTGVGDFEFVKQLGQGGNATVYSFKKCDTLFAIKFIEQLDANKIARFVDEFFCSAQIDTHINIARSYHLDSVEVQGKTFSLIVMKQYEKALSRATKIADSSDEEKAKKGWKILRDLVGGLAHLHQNGIIHRDIKPENIFIDNGSTLVIGDLGIAHFSEDFDREAKTKAGERLSNRLFSAPEQEVKDCKPHPRMDIYALGQVLCWYLYGSPVRGAGRTKYSGNNPELQLLDAIIERCIQHHPENRFQSISDISDFEAKSKIPYRDIFERLHDLDSAFRSSLPNMRDFYVTSNTVEINRFLTNFSNSCQMDEFWYITSTGGDMTLSGFSQITEGRWLLHNHYELKIEKLVCYKNSSLHKSLFILITAADIPFTLVDFEGNEVQRSIPLNWKTDYTALYDGKYMNPDRFQSGYFEHKEQVLPVEQSKYSERERVLHPDAFMIVPDRTGPSRVTWTDNRDLLTKIAEERTITKEELFSYLHKCAPFTDPKITQWL